MSLFTSIIIAIIICVTIMFCVLYWKQIRQIFEKHNTEKIIKYNNLSFSYTRACENNLRRIYYDAVLKQDFLIFKADSKLKEIFIFADLEEVSILDENDFTYIFDFSKCNCPRLIQKLDRNGYFLIDSGEEIINLN